MGIFDFLKKKKVESEQLKFNEVASWLEKEFSKEMEIFNQNISSLKEKIIEEKNKTEQHLQKLAVEVLKNEKIPERAKQMMEGNRTTYLQKVRGLLSQINPPENYPEYEQFFVTIENDFERFSEVTLRNYQILREFFSNDISAIARNLKKFNELLKEMKQIVIKTNINGIILLQNSVRELIVQRQRKEENKIKVLELKETVSKNEIGVQKIQKKIVGLKNGEIYSKHLNSIKEKEKLELQRRNLTNSVFQSFSVISAGLKKYERVTLDGSVVKAYNSNPISALLEDKELQIITVLAKMKGALNKLDLKEKKHVKVEQGINVFTKEYLQDFLVKYGRFSNQLNEVENVINSASIVTELVSLEDDLRKEQMILQNIQEKVSLLEAIKEDDSIEELSSRISKQFGKEIVIVV
ncbi:hypothetical protein HOI26_04385 [Candidatus Woesearchaeota archaeon]|nr:hypothetical protein [Candidatus Woesearchaeota archaeon]